MTSPADKIIADAVTDVITAAIAEEMPTAWGEDIERAAARAVTDLRRLGWHITALPVHRPPDPHQ